ncbi:MAG: HAD family phosphatase, partial [Chloroflexi bacterium]|nr:HAD family phosphatase [Chloroflexota bacterium]
MNVFEAIIFDRDGVSVDSEPRHERAFREIFTEMGYAESHGMDFVAYYGDRTGRSGSISSPSTDPARPWSNWPAEIEEATAGVEAALAAGMKVIAIINSLPKSKLARATRVVSTYEEIDHL